MTNSQKSEKSTSTKQIQQPRRCLYCGQHAELIWVHGHGQCSACGINTQECCQGENCAFNQNQ